VTSTGRKPGSIALAGLWSTLAILTPGLLRAADKPAITFAGPGPVALSGLNTEGWVFSVSQDVTAVAVGFWDSNGDGLTSDHQVGIWDEAGTLLRSAVVVSSSSLRGGFRYAGVDPLPLQAGGTYTIGAVQAGGSADAVATRVLSLASDPSIRFVQTVIGEGSGSLVRPTIRRPEQDPGYFGPNFLIAGPCVCNGFDLERTGGGSLTNGEVFSRFRTNLLDPALFGPRGRAPNSISMGSGLSTLTMGSVAGIDVFFTGVTATTSYTDLEKVSLVNLVKGGMNLVATMDDTNHSIADLFNVTLRNGGDPGQIAVLTEHPVFSGPFGRITRFRGAAATAHFTAWPEDATILATNELGQATMLLLAPGTAGLPVLSGTVLLISDTDVLTTVARNLDPGSSTPDIPETDAFALNVAAYLCDRWAPASTPDLVFPQVANGAGNISALNVSNAGTSTAQAVWKFFGDDGRPLAFATGSGSADTIRSSLEPNATARTVVTDGKQGGVAQPVSGWASVKGSPALSGNVIFTIPGLGTTSVGASELAGGFLVPIVQQPSASGLADALTGIAITNYGARSSTVRLEIWDPDGKEVAGGMTTITLPALGHTAQFLHQLFPGFNFAGFTGSLRAVSLDGLIAVTGLQLGALPGEFTTLPVKPQHR